MIATSLRAILAAVLLGLIALPTTVLAEGLEVTDVRTDNYPRVTVRFSANAADGSPISNIKPGQLKVWEGDAPAQSQLDFYSLRETSPELWVTLVMDVSGSMNDDGKLQQAKDAAKGFIARLRSKDRVSIVTFSDKVILQQQPTGDPGILGRAIDALQANGPTRMNDGVARGVTEILRARDGARRALILLSDGDDTDSQVDLPTAIGPAIAARVPIYTIGLGTDVKAEVLAAAARDTKARYYPAPRAQDLDYVFKLLSGQLSSQYEAWWQSTTTVTAGSTVAGRIRIEVPGTETLEAPISYVVPVSFRPMARPEAAATLPLKNVDLAANSGWDLPEYWPLVAAGLAALGVYIAFYGAIVRMTLSRGQERLSAFVGSYQHGRNRVIGTRQLQRKSMRPLVLNLARFTHRITPTKILDDLRQRLVLAGRPSGWHFSQFLASKMLLAGILGFVGYMVTAAGQADPLFFLVVTFSLAFVGWYLPHFWLGGQIRARQKAIQRALPDALDLMTVGVGAGLSLDGAILEIVEKNSNQLSQELANFLAEMRMGRSRREALQGLQARTAVDDMKVLVASLIQADELGMSLSETLMVQADQMRLRRKQRAEELAHKATVKMMIPMILLIFPALFVVIIGPAVPSMLEFLTKGSG